mmetsp:Transcript_20175/g.69947  ORF Transcript_20175/g.69947 Transcript_20175/m.69947 type:complete len:251 (+) Transcript_20175:348-1100(+)
MHLHLTELELNAHRLPALGECQPRCFRVQVDLCRLSFYILRGGYENVRAAGLCVEDVRIPVVHHAGEERRVDKIADLSDHRGEAPPSRKCSFRSLEGRLVHEDGKAGYNRGLVVLLEDERPNEDNSPGLDGGHSAMVLRLVEEQVEPNGLLVVCQRGDNAHHAAGRELEVRDAVEGIPHIVAHVVECTPARVHDDVVCGLRLGSGGCGLLGIRAGRSLRCDGFRRVDQRRDFRAQWVHEVRAEVQLHKGR